MSREGLQPVFEVFEEGLVRVEGALATLRSAERLLEAWAAALPPAAPGAAPTPVAAEPADLKNPKAFFDYVRTRPPLGPTLTAEEVAGCNRILRACAGLPVSWAAYILATAYHETDGALRPRREYGKGAGKRYGRPGARMDGGPAKAPTQIPYGRGDVQLTWEDNYERADRELDLGGRLLADFDLALDPDLSAQILVGGMVGGWFTGKGLELYLPARADAAQFRNARRTVNGTDRADLIAGYAVTFQPGLVAGGWAS